MALSTPNLLFVVPTLNSYLLLPRLLRSLQQSTFQNWRVLFIDGESSVEHRRWLRNCSLHEPRCKWVVQDSTTPGIFGAMNQGFASADPEEWILFWGSDDWSASPHALSTAMNAIQSAVQIPDLLVCEGRYVHASSEAFRRSTRFQQSGLLHAHAFRRALFFGSTPPHQATLFGPRVRSKLSEYDLSFGLSADLDYFLQISLFPDLLVKSLSLELVHMADGGISGQMPKRRLSEVCFAYRRSFGKYWWFTFFHVMSVVS